MCELICVTNRALCKGDFLARIEDIAKARPSGIILREKDLLDDGYEKLAAQVLEICKKHGVKCILHSYIDVAIKLDCEYIHLPLPMLRAMSDEQKKSFKEIGASCHSVQEAVEAEKLGCAYITAGHIFATDCKKDLPPRGADFLQKVCKAASVPVYAIGGITPATVKRALKAKPRGVCVMSGLMQCGDAEEYIKSFRQAMGK